MVTQPLGLLQRQVDVVLGRAQQAAVHFDVVALEVRLRAELGDGRAIHRDAAFEDQFLGFAAAGDAGLREDLL